MAIVKGKKRKELRPFPVTASLLLLTSCLCLWWLVFRVITCPSFLRDVFLVVSIQVSVNQRSIVWALHQSSQQSKGKWCCFKICWSNPLTHAWCFSTSVAPELWLLAGMFCFSLAACKFSWVVRGMLLTNASGEFLLHVPCTVSRDLTVPLPFFSLISTQNNIAMMKHSISSWGLHTAWFQTKWSGTISQLPSIRSQ